MIMSELERIWKKRAFLIMIIGALLLNIFILWYGDAYNSDSIPLSAYKKLDADMQNIGGNKEVNKEAYLTEEKELMDTMLFVEKSAMYLAQNTDLGDAYVEYVLSKDNNMEHYNTYLPVYMSEEYLKYTDNLTNESKLIYRVCEEYEQVSSYAEYIKNIGAKQDAFSQMSIFASSENGDSFANKNIKKSMEDHMGMENIEPEYITARGIHGVFRFSVSDMLAILLTVYFALQLIWEEKETAIYNVTRATYKGRACNIIAKLTALLIHTAVISFVFFLINYLWYGINAGFVDMFAPVQSAAEYMGSSFRWNFLQMTMAVLFSKCAGCFFVGMFIMLFAQLAKAVWIPWFGCGVFLGGSAAIYELIDVHGSWAAVKYISCISLFHGGNLWGQYLNVNLFGKPVSAVLIAVSVLALVLVILLVSNIVIFLFFYEGSLSSKKAKLLPRVHVKAMGNKLLLQEMHKIFIMNKGIVVVIIFFAAMGYMHFSEEYKMSAGENYYQEFMLKLEGDLDASKEAIIKDEQSKYDDANAQIEIIDSMLAEGSISEIKAGQMKNKYEMILSFYPQFEKVLYHYEEVKENGTPFLYDTGYREYFWLNGGRTRILTDCFMAALAILLIFGSIYSMEQECGSWMLIGTTTIGQKTIKKKKLIISLVGSFFGAVCSAVCRLAAIDMHYPIRQIMYSAASVRGLEVVKIPVIFLIAASILVHAVIYILIALIILFISSKRSRTAEVYVFASIVLLIPMLLGIIFCFD